MRWGASIAFGLGVFLGLPASAGTVVTVQTIEGTLSLNRGDGYVEVLSWADAPSGSQVMANPGSRGKVIYSDGCEVNVSPGSVYTVQDSSPCGSGVMGGGSARNYVIGGLVIAGDAVAVIALTGGDDSDNGKHKKKKKHEETTIRRAPRLARIAHARLTVPMGPQPATPPSQLRCRPSKRRCCCLARGPHHGYSGSGP